MDFHFSTAATLLAPISPQRYFEMKNFFEIYFWPWIGGAAVAAHFNCVSRQRRERYQMFPLWLKLFHNFPSISIGLLRATDANCKWMRFSCKIYKLADFNLTQLGLISRESAQVEKLIISAYIPDFNQTGTVSIWSRLKCWKCESKSQHNSLKSCRIRKSPSQHTICSDINQEKLGFSFNFCFSVSVFQLGFSYFPFFVSKCCW